MENTKFCKFCGEKIDKSLMVCPKCGRQLQTYKENKEQPKGEQQKKVEDKTKVYTQTWFMWVMLIIFPPIGIFLMWKFNFELEKKTKIILSIVFGLLFILLLTSNTNEASDNNGKIYNSGTNVSNSKKVEIIDFSSMNEIEILSWCKENNLNCNIKREYSDTIPKDEYIKQSSSVSAKVPENSKVTISFSLGKEPSAEYKNALKKAQSYAKTLHMSKQAIYDQLTSTYGENFEKDAAQYAIDNIEWDWEANALAKAKSYRDTMSMSKNAIYEQLISEYGEQFTEEEAQYAIDHLDE